MPKSRPREPQAAVNVGASGNAWRLMVATTSNLGRQRTELAMVQRDIAELLIKELLAMGQPLISATQLIDQIASKDERRQFRRGLGEVMDQIYIDLMRPIIRQYPDLDP